MLKSKNISHFFSTPANILKPNRVLTFDLYLYFQTANHILLWRHRGETLTQEWIDLYLRKGLRTIWIHQDDRAALDSYTNSNDDQELEKTLSTTLQAAPAPAETKEPTPATVARTLNSPDIPIQEKKNSARSVAQETLKQLLSDDKIDDPNQPPELVDELIREIIKHSPLMRELMSLSTRLKELNHSHRTLNYALVYALASEFVQLEDLIDLSVAAVLHDIGHCWVPASLSRTPWMKLTDEEKAKYFEHVELGVQWLSHHCVEAGAKAIKLIRQHHEKFDGSGFPAGEKGFGISDLAQILSMAELTSQIQSGTWDGTERSLKQTFESLKMIENDLNFPQYFNPEIFGKVWSQAS